MTYWLQKFVSQLCYTSFKLMLLKFFIWCLVERNAPYSFYHKLLDYVGILLEFSLVILLEFSLVVYQGWSLLLKNYWIFFSGEVSNRMPNTTGYSFSRSGGHMKGSCDAEDLFTAPHTMIRPWLVCELGIIKSSLSLERKLKW